MKYVSEFVKRQQALNKRIVSRLVWDSSPRRPKIASTYFRKINGELR